MDKGEKNDKKNITKVFAKNIEARIISARVKGLIKTVVDVLLFFNVHIPAVEVGSDFGKKIRIYSYSHSLIYHFFD